MLYRLEIENFYSIRHSQVIDLRVRGKVAVNLDRFAPIWRNASDSAPKVIAFFGPNASGKSNVLRSLAFLSWFVQQSFQHPAGQPLPADRFNEEKAWIAPTRLALEFGGPEDLSDDGGPEVPECRYRFELEFEGAGARRVREALFYWPLGATRRMRVFERDFSGKIQASKGFGLAGFRLPLEKILRPEASVISTLVQLGHPSAKKLHNLAHSIVSNILIQKDIGYEDLTVQHLSMRPDVVADFNREIERIGLGVRALEIVQGGVHGPVALFQHEGLSGPVPLAKESHGTRQFLIIYPKLHHVLRNGGILVVDELDSSIHPLLLPELLRWFYDPKRNPHGAQLWISCHSASLLEELVKEEVFFCEKNACGQTEVYSLSDIKSFRRRDNFYKKYLSGAYGAVPLLG